MNCLITFLTCTTCNPIKCIELIIGYRTLSTGGWTTTTDNSIRFVNSLMYCLKKENRSRNFLSWLEMKCVHSTSEYQVGKSALLDRIADDNSYIHNKRMVQKKCARPSKISDEYQQREWLLLPSRFPLVKNHHPDNPLDPLVSFLVNRKTKFHRFNTHYFTYQSIPDTTKPTSW